MATYFVFGNTPVIKNLIDFTGKDEKSGAPVKIKDADFKKGHYMVNINDHSVGVLCNEAELINAIYAIDEDNEGIRLFTSLIEQWGEINSNRKTGTTQTIVDDDMGLYLNYV